MMQIRPLVRVCLEIVFHRQCFLFVCADGNDGIGAETCQGMYVYLLVVFVNTFLP